MEWRVPRRKLVLASAEYEEIEETIGSILKKFNQKRILTVCLLHLLLSFWTLKHVFLISDTIGATDAKDGRSMEQKVCFV